MAYRAVINNAGVIETHPLNPSEKFAGSEDTTLADRTILDYWQWGFSDIVGNTERGILAEYIVAMAGCRAISNSAYHKTSRHGDNSDNSRTNRKTDGQKHDGFWTIMKICKQMKQR